MKRCHDDAHGLSARETEILDLHEAGLEQAEIAQQLGVAVSYVAWAIRSYGFDTCLGTSLSFEAAARRGSEALLTAIRATGQVHT